MPLIAGLIPRRGHNSDANLRRHSSVITDFTPNADFRSSEQIPRDYSQSMERESIHIPPAFHSPATQPSNRPVTPPVQEQSPKHKRFSMLKFRHASDPQLSARARLHARAENAPPVPKPPNIIMTAPTMELQPKIMKRKPKLTLGRSKTSMEVLVESDANNRGKVTFDTNTHPPAYEESNSTLNLPMNRLSESSRSDASQEQGHGSGGSTIFRLTRRKKQRHLFPLPDRVERSNITPPRPSISSFRSTQSETPMRRPPTADDQGSPVATVTQSAIARSGVPFAAPGSPRLPPDFNASPRSSLAGRGRSGTLNSLKMTASEDPLPTPPLRNSTSTGRKSFGDLLGLSARLRQNSEPLRNGHGSTPATPGSTVSNSNSLQLSREKDIVMPERLENESPANYLVRLEEAVSRGVVASVLCKSTDPFSASVLRSYMRGFGMFGDPMDMAIRKLLMEVELPKETQQIDRCLQAFANRYHECNPGIYENPDQAYFIAFSLLMLHTDVFNKNNKNKMQKGDYLRNTASEGIFDDILECFYDNIAYTPFIHVEDDLNINGERIVPGKGKKRSVFNLNNSDPLKRPKEPIDPYTLIIDGKLDTLRPNLKDVMYLEEHYSYLGTAKSLNLQELHKTFFRTGVLQIVSARSRPDAFMTEATATNPEEAQPGVVDIKITKVGLLWRKDAKKKKTRSPWQEWGAILTGAQLYFFRNTNWIKNLMHQLESHQKPPFDGTPVVFKPPIEQFKPDALMSTDNAVALLDSTYKKHKNAFVFVRHGGFEETLLADNEEEMNDWLAKLNYAAAFKTSGVRMRGLVGGHYDGQRTRGIRRLDSSSGNVQSIQTPTGEVTIMSGRIDLQMAHDILAARRDIMKQRIEQMEEKLAAAQKQLDINLRNARHLQILAPIQPRTREQILSSAAKMAAKLKWMRMEMWRLRCHRDILVMDMDEERTSDVIGTPRSAERLSRHESKASGPSLNPPPPQEAVAVSQPPSRDSELDHQDAFQTPPIIRSSSFHRQQASRDIPQLDFTRPRRESSVSQPRSPGLAHASSKASIKPQSVSESSQSAHPASPRLASPLDVDLAELTVLQEAGLAELSTSPDGNKRPTTQSTTNEEPKDAGDGKDDTDKLHRDRSKIRRSLQRTLREAHTPSHHRSRKGKDSSSSAGLSDEVFTKDDQLTRGVGSFTVHGKKASVITFGSELQNMSQGERHRRRMSQRSDRKIDETSDTLSPILAEGRLSAASASSTPAQSFREAHSRLGVAPLDETAVSESGSETFSIIEREIPVPGIDDGPEDSPTGQNTFYTPENISPVTSSTDEGNSEEEARRHQTLLEVPVET